MKHRKVKIIAKNGGKPCSGGESMSCAEPCPGTSSLTIFWLRFIVQCYQFYPYITLNYTTSEHCQMEPWSAWEWSNGAKSCGTGTRTRYAKIAALHGGDSCEKRFGKDFGKETMEIPCVGEFKKV